MTMDKSISSRGARKAIVLSLLVLAGCAQQPVRPTVIMGPTVDTGWWRHKYRREESVPEKWRPPIGPAPSSRSFTGPSSPAPVVGPPAIVAPQNSIPPPPEEPAPTVQALEDESLSPKERKKRIHKKLEDIDSTIHTLRQGLTPEDAQLPSKDKGKVLPPIPPPQKPPLGEPLTLPQILTPPDQPPPKPPSVEPTPIVPPKLGPTTTIIGQ